MILGLDPGTRITGYGIIIQNEKRELIPIDFGTIRPPAKKPLNDRYRIIFELVSTLIDKYSPEEVAVETQYIHKNPQSGIKLGMARAAVILPALLQGIPVFEYAPTRVKRAVVGRGGASKEQVQKMVQHLLGLAKWPTPEDAADALALAICHTHVKKCMNISTGN